MNTELISDLTCESDVIGYLLSYPDGINDVGEFLTTDSFTEPHYKEIYNTIVNLNDKGTKIEVVAVWNELSKHNTQIKQMQLYDYAVCNYYGSIQSAALRLRDLEQRRAICHLANIVIAQSNGSEAVSLDEIYDRIRAFLDVTDGNVQVVNLRAALEKVEQRIQRNNEGIQQVSGTRTGFRKIDETGGLHAGNLVVVAGSTSHGKTSFALSVTLNAIEAGEKVIYYSLEMDVEELTSRLIAMRSGVPASTIMYHRVYAGDLEKVKKAMRELPRENLLFDDKATTKLETILASIRSMHRKYKIKGAVIDYLQILNINNQSRENQEQLMAYAARRMKNLAKELGVWIMALSQLNREGGDKAQPSLSRLRNSGQIAEAADVVILIYRPEVLGLQYKEREFSNISAHNTALVEIAKGRNIGTGKFVCRFIPELTYFYDDPQLRPNAKEQAEEEKNEPF